MPKKDKSQSSRSRKKDQRKKNFNQGGKYSSRSIRIKIKEASNHQKNLKKNNKA